MPESVPIFKAWVSDWFAKIILFVLLLPGIVLFFLPLSNINAAAGHYGAEPADIQFSVALFYAGYAGFYNLERRFFVYLAAKEYFIIFTFLQIFFAYICYSTDDLNIFFLVRFIQGILFASNVNLSLSLIFSRLHSERAREISFSVFFGMLLCAIPFNNIVTADLIDNFNFNCVYKAAVFSYIPGLFFLIVSMNNVRLSAKFPLYQLDLQSFTFYSAILCLIGYVTIYGQEYYWLEDARIRSSCMAMAVFVLVYVVRQKSLKRAYTDLSVFRHRNFNIALLLLFIMYICRFASGITNNFFATVLKFDPKHISYINTFNLAGLISGVIISCSLILQKKRIRLIWLTGFFFLFAFHVIMFFLFNMQANEYHYFVPLFIQGFGVGMIMVPTIVYAISSVPVHLGPSAAGICLTTRFLGFCASIAFINYFELFGKSRHYNAFQDQLTKINPVVTKWVQLFATTIASKGAATQRSLKISRKMLLNSVAEQSQIRFAMDYYELMAWLLASTLLLLIMFPYLNRTIINLRSRRLSPA